MLGAKRLTGGELLSGLSSFHAVTIKTPLQYPSECLNRLRIFLPFENLEQIFNHEKRKRDFKDSRRTPEWLNLLTEYTKYIVTLTINM